MSNNLSNSQNYLSLHSILDKSELEIAQNLGLKTILDLALYLPNYYENNHLIKDIYSNDNGAVEIVVLQNLRSHKMLKIIANARHFDRNIEILIFNPSPYHSKIYRSGAQLLISGEISELKMINPKIITTANEIAEKFATKKYKSKTIVNLRKKIKKENLQNIGLPSSVINGLLSLINVDLKTLQMIKNYKNIKKQYSPQILHALKFAELYNHLAVLKTKSKIFAPNFNATTHYKGFSSALPFTLTTSQVEILEEIYRDFIGDVATRRLVMGDVGSGKTMIILGAVFMMLPHTSIILAPTTILAHQLYSEASKYLKSAKIALVTAREDILKTKSKEKYNLYIGTQAILYRDILEIEDVALIITDEQHKFGTKDRNELEMAFSDHKSKKRAFTLQSSATPIPRTMALINSNLIKVSKIHTLPFTKNISTTICDENGLKEAIEFIKGEIALNHQAIIVYPLIEKSENINYKSIEESRNYFEKHFKNVYVTNSKDKDKDQKLEEFRERGDLLLTTTVIEVGISLPRLSSIIIIAPERFGLATLHQLRGRVSRNGLRGYCFLCTKSKDIKRLERFSSTTNGFEIAEIDLETREAGDLLSGVRQSGQIFRFFTMQDYAIANEVKEALDKI